MTFRDHTVTHYLCSLRLQVKPFFPRRPSRSVHFPPNHLGQHSEHSTSLPKAHPLGSRRETAGTWPLSPRVSQPDSPVGAQSPALLSALLAAPPLGGPQTPRSLRGNIFIGGCRRKEQLGQVSQRTLSCSPQLTYTLLSPPTLSATPQTHRRDSFLQKLVIYKINQLVLYKKKPILFTQAVLDCMLDAVGLQATHSNTDMREVDVPVCSLLVVKFSKVSDVSKTVD